MTTTEYHELTGAIARLLVRTEKALDRKVADSVSHSEIRALEGRATVCQCEAEYLHNQMFNQEG